MSTKTTTKMAIKKGVPAGSAECGGYRSRLEAFLEGRHKRQTPERFALLDAIAEKNCSFTADDLCNEMERRKFRVARSTVYNFIKTLCSAGIVRRARTDSRMALYELCDTTAGGNIVLICRICGKKILKRDNLLTASLSLKQFRGFVVEDWDLTFSGICSTCRRHLP